jgi:hypothetical protein
MAQPVEIAQLFAVSTGNIGLHLKNLYVDGEPSRAAIFPQILIDIFGRL